MKTEDSQQVNAGEAESGRNSEVALHGAEADVTTRKRTQAPQARRTAAGWSHEAGCAQRTKAEKERQGELMEAVVERGNLMLAFDRVLKNKGAAGVDGIGVTEFKAHLKQHWPTIKAKLLAGEYMPLPVRRVDIPKPQGGVRTLGIPTLTVRLIQLLGPSFSNSIAL